MHKKNRCVSIIVTSQRSVLSGVPDLRTAGCKRVTCGHVVATEGKKGNHQKIPGSCDETERQETNCEPAVAQRWSVSPPSLSLPPACTHFDDEEEMEVCVWDVTLL